MTDEAESTSRRGKPARRMVRRILLFLGGCFLLIVVLDIDWTGPGEPPPTDVIEYDGHRWEITSLDYLRDIGLDVESIPVEENASLDYAVARKLLVPFPAGGVREPTSMQEAYVFRYCWVADCELLWSYMQACAPALQRAQRGLGKARAGPLYSMDSALLLDLMPVHLGGTRNLGRQFILRGKQSEAHGLYDDALDDYRAPLVMGNQAAQGCFLIDGLVATTLHRTGLDALDRLVLSGPPVPVLHEALEMTRQTEAGQPDFGRALRGERVLCFDLIRAYGKFEVYESMLDTDWRSAEGRLFGRSRTVRRIAWARTVKLFDRADRWSALPRRARNVAWAALLSETGKATKDWFADDQAVILLTALQLHRLYVVNDARWAAAEVRIGLALYKAEHGRYPETLDEIEPYLGEVPLDPFVEEPFHYRLEGDEYVFYSVGSDLTDDGGVDERTDTTLLYGSGWQDRADLVFTSKLAPPPPVDEYIENKGRQPPSGWSTEQ